MAAKDVSKDKDKDKEVDLTKQVAALTDLVGKLAGGFDAQNKAINDLTTNVGSLSNMNKEQLAAQQAATAAASEEGEQTFDSNDLEGMDRSAFMDVILNKMNKGFDQFSEQMTTKLDNVNNSVSSSNVKSELKEVMDKNSDFNHYKTEISEIAKQNPEMKISDMYTLAKANNPERVAEVDKILKTESDQKQVEDAAKGNQNKTKGYGGLTPTSGQRQEMPSDMTQDAAGTSAWDETMADIELEQ